MKRVISLLLCLLLTVSLCGIASGCGNNGGNSKTDILKGKTIRIASWGQGAKPSEGTEDGDLIAEQVKAAEEKYGCKVEYLTIPDITQQILTAATTGQVIGEAIVFKTHRIRELLMKGDFYWSLEELGQDPKNELFNADTSNYSTFNGKTYGWWYQPTFVNNVCVINKKVLSLQGIKVEDYYSLVEDRKWNFEAWNDLMLKALNPTEGILGCGQVGTFTTLVMHANDTSMYTVNKDGLHVQNTADPKLTQVFEFLSNCSTKDKTIKFNIGSTADQIQTDFISGKYATMFCGLSGVRDILPKKMDNADWGIMPIPMGPSATEYAKIDAECRAFCIQKAVPLDEAKAIFEFINEAFVYPFDETTGMESKYKAFCPDKQSIDNMMLMQALPLRLVSEYTEPDVRTYFNFMGDLNGMAEGTKPIKGTLDSLSQPIQATLDEYYGQKSETK